MKIPELSLYLITDRHQTLGRNLLTVLEEAIRGGVRAIQLREKDLSARELYTLAQEVRKLTEMAGVKLFINDRVDVALAIEADGVHLGQQSLPPHVVRRLIGNKLLGVSTHNLQEALQAQDSGVDFITFGPLFFTPSKAPYGKPVGLEALKEVRKFISVPILGLGGIKKDSVREVLLAGADGISVISAILCASDVYQAAKELTEVVLSQRREIAKS
ncbi:MAG TPA: thiamine phosphate synthase [Candidatus Limnocylindrales bacterium]|nr:thiamine phosphate synthase [Candidatus Limnocylindrales bacterium]